MKARTDRKAREKTTGNASQRPSPRVDIRLGIRILLQHQFPVAAISLALGCAARTVLNWKNRLEAGDNILDRPRTGRPRTIPSEVDQRLIAFYCQHNPLPGCNYWTIRWAETFLNAHPEILKSSISRPSIQRRLNSHALRPYRSKYYMNITDPCFFPIMENIIFLYLNPPEYLFGLDECTGLQALERIAPILPAQGDRPAYLDPEYERHGTVSILSVLRVSSGRVFTECIPDHKATTIISSLKRHISQYPQSATLHYILDNYSSHSTEDFCREIAALCDVQLPKLKTLIERKQWMESPDKRIIFHFLPSHGSWLNLIEIWFGILQQKAIKGESFPSAVELQKRIMDFTETWNTHFAHPFQWSYTGEGLHEKVISRLTTWLQMESSQLTGKFLEKQIKLMSNLATGYWSKAKPVAWDALKTALYDKQEFINTIIGTNPKVDLLLINLHNVLDSSLKAC